MTPADRFRPATQIPFCQRVPVERVRKVLPEAAAKIFNGFITTLEQEQRIAHCCRHPENHEVEALKSNPDEKAPDIYIFHCTCGRMHRRFCTGGGVRPAWEFR